LVLAVWRFRPLSRVKEVQEKTQARLAITVAHVKVLEAEAMDAWLTDAEFF
jgi:hypothetical protein